MENPLIGKFFTFSDPDEGEINGKTEIVQHIDGPYYYVRNFDLRTGIPDYCSLINLKVIRGIPLFSSVGDMAEFFRFSLSVNTKKTTEVSH